MKNSIMDAFDSVHMSDECTQKIKTAMMNKTVPSHTRTLRRIAAAAACLLAVLMVIGSPAMAIAKEAAEELVSKIAAEMGITTIQSSYVSDDGNYVAIQGTTEEGHNIGGGSYNTGTTPTWLKEADGRLYFCGNGEMIDITDLISYEEAFTYIYTDDAHITHYIAVGGEYTGDLADFRTGWTELFRYEHKPGIDPVDGTENWIGGYGAHFGDPAYEWYVEALADFETPWSE